MILNKTAVIPETHLQPAFFYSSAREGMRDFLVNTLQSPDEGILLPAFIGWSEREGSGVFDPVSDSKSRFGFYDLNANLSVNIADLERQLQSGLYKVLIVIHYFGRTEPQIALIRDLADRHGVLLVEDLAHGFFSSLGDGQAGRYGHVNLFSLHKMFPFSNGGLIRYADSGLVSHQKSTMPGLAERLLSYDWQAISRARRQVFCALTSILETMPECNSRFELMWPDLDENDVPQTLPVRILGGGRDHVYSAMNRDGFGMVSLYHTLIGPVRDGFRNLNSLASEITNFPVHQDVNESVLPAMAESFRRHLAASQTDSP